LNDMHLMRAKDIDRNGYWHVNGCKINLMEESIPVPKQVRTVNDTEHCLMLVKANEFIPEGCPDCGTQFSDDIVVLVLETVRLVPAKCCDLMMWYVETPTGNYERENYGMET